MSRLKRRDSCRSLAVDITEILGTGDQNLVDNRHTEIALQAKVLKGCADCNKPQCH
jgi:hypothetical protein